MAMAKTICKCETCGKEFEVFKNCYNRREAESYEAWAASNVTLCPDCRRKAEEARNANKAAEIINRYNLPEIEGVSEKQIAYATSLRNSYIAKHSDKFEIAEEIKSFPEDKLKELATENNTTAEEIISENLEAYEATKAYALLALNNASKIIDLLK